MRSRIAIGLLFLGFAAAVKADPPGRVARVSYIDGSVSFRPGSLDDWAPASLNYPMSVGDHLWTAENSRAEVHVGSIAFRLGAQTAFEFLNLDDRTVQVKIAEGNLLVHPRRLPEDQILEVDTPNSAVSIDRPGLYRISVTEDGRSTVTVRHGEAELTAAGQAVPIRAREAAYIDGTDSPTYDVQEAGPEDSFDEWNVARDRREDNVTSTRYVSSEVVGYEDLDHYGRWREVGDYGPVWTPASVEVGWAPYRSGHWAWVAPWGWTWVDDAPWGFAPFHYGRWAYVEGSWGWCPGTIVAAPVYAPALVAFVGGGGWSASLSFGGGFGSGVGAVAWFPLGPHEIYVPPYPVSPAYVQQVNITHVTNININNFTVNNGVVTNVNIQRTTYVNQVAPGAVTAVPQSAFVSARSVASVAAVVPPRAIAGVAMVHTPGGVQPQPVSVLGVAPGAARVAAPSAAIMNRSFVAKVAPAPKTLSFSPVLKPVTSNLPPRPASEALHVTGLKAAVPASGGAGLKAARPNLVAPRAVNATETHALPAVQNNTNPAVQGNTIKEDKRRGTTNESTKPSGTRPSTGGETVKPTNEGTTKPQAHKPAETYKPTNEGTKPGQSGEIHKPSGETTKPATHNQPESYRPTGEGTTTHNKPAETSGETTKSETHKPAETHRPTNETTTQPETHKPAETHHPTNETTTKSESHKPTENTKPTGEKKPESHPSPHPTSESHKESNVKPTPKPSPLNR